MVAYRAGVFWCKNAHLSERLFEGCHFRCREQFVWFCFSLCCFVVFHFYWNVPIRKVIINFNTLSAFSQKAPNQANTLQPETKKTVVWQAVESLPEI